MEVWDRMEVLERVCALKRKEEIVAVLGFGGMVGDVQRMSATGLRVRDS